MAYGTVNTDLISDSSGGKLAPISSVFRNRIINGAMVISQRGTSFANDASGAQYSLDRWNIYGSNVSKFTVAQSSSAPAGFSNSLLVTSSAATTVGASETYLVQQSIEGFNTADLNWGTANAKTVTLSFWVQSSLTGTFGGSISNSAFDYSYPFSYSIPVANTWTQINITIAGPTAGTWIGATNGNGMRVEWSMGSGSSVSGTAGAWTASGLRSATGAVQVVATNAATWSITGVQLEVGSSATGFEYRQYQQELALCQRYYEQSPALNIYYNTNVVVCVAVNLLPGMRWLVPKRAAPTVVLYSRSGTANKVSLVTNGGDYGTSVTSNISTTTNFHIVQDSGAGFTVGAGYEYNYTASAEL